MTQSTTSDLQTLLTHLDAELENELESRLRTELEKRDASWLVDALVQRVLRDRRLGSDPANRQLSRHEPHVEPLAERRRRLERIVAMGLDEKKVREIVNRFSSLDRQTLESQSYLIEAPHKGKEALGQKHRSEKGNALLQEAHDLFYALLFCDAKSVAVERTRRDFLTVTLPSAKSSTLERFMLAVTETKVSGTWLDPEGVSDDIDATNTILQVEYGDSSDSLISDGLVAALKVINNLEVNEEILYARIEKLEKSTLVD